MSSPVIIPNILRFNMKNNILPPPVNITTQRALLSLALLACFSSANAASFPLNGQSVDNKTYDGNVVAGRFDNQSNHSAFDPSVSINSTLNNVSINGGDLIIGNYATTSTSDSATPIFNVSLNSINVVVSNSEIGENLVLGSKVNSYGQSKIVSNINNANLTLENSTVGLAVVVGQLHKSWNISTSASLKNAAVNIIDSTIGGLIVGPAVYHMDGDNTPNAEKTVSVGDVVVTIQGSTIKKLESNAISGTDVDYQGAAIFMGGAAGNLMTKPYPVSNSVSTGSLTLTLVNSKIEGNVYMGGVSEDADGNSSSASSVESSNLIFGEGTQIAGTLYTGGYSSQVSGDNATVQAAKIILDSTDVEITGGVSQDAESAAKSVQYEGTAAFNDENISAAESLKKLRTILGLSDEIVDIQIAEGESNGAISGDGMVTLNTKTERIGRTTALNVLTWRLEMNDMNKRLGELRDNKGQTGLWARVNGGKMKFMGEKNNFQQFQFGADHKIDALAGIRLGAAFSFTNSDLDYADGSGDNKIYGLAGYGSWLGENGSFVDVIAKIARLESDSTVDQTHSDFNTTAYSFSAEIGHRFNLAPAFIEPQLELSYGHVSGKTFDTVNRVTNIAANTTVEAVDSLVGRAGLRAGLTCPQQKGGAYLHFSVLHEFDGDVVVRRGDGAYQQDMGDTWVEYGIGGNYNFTPFTQLYADVERTSGADLSEPWRVNVGLRHSF